MKNAMIRLTLGMALPLALAAAAMAAEKVPDTPGDPGATCAEMMKGAGPEGEKAMPEGMMGGGTMSPPDGRPGK